MSGVPGQTMAAQTNYLIGQAVVAPVLVIVVGAILGAVFKKTTADGKVFNKTIFRIALGIAFVMVLLSLFRGVQ